MLSNFEKDRLAAKEAEQIVLNFLSTGLPQYQFKDVSESRGCLLRGDIVAYLDNMQLFIEVKDDSCIATTHNVLVEDAVYYHSSGNVQKYQSSSDVYTVVSKEERKIYFFNHEKLKKLAKFAPARTIVHEEQTTYCNLVSLDDTKRTGAFLGVAKY